MVLLRCDIGNCCRHITARPTFWWDGLWPGRRHSHAKFMARVIVVLAAAISPPARADAVTRVAGSAEETTHENSTVQMVPK